jgi:hypothetical protein
MLFGVFGLTEADFFGIILFLAGVLGQKAVYIYFERLGGDFVSTLTVYKIRI